MKTKHTQGPWHIGMQPGPIIYGAKGAQVADLRGERKTLVIELDEAVANTRLIAASPALLAALEAITACPALATGTDMPADLWIAAINAVSKAKGE